MTVGPLELPAVDPTLLVIPLVSGVIGYATNWVGIRLLFYPVEFVGFRLPGLEELARLLPRRLQQIPGVMQGGVGWQGIIPSRAEKMGSIAVDKGIAKLGSPREFYEQLEPDQIARHILEHAQDDIRELVERIIRREHPRLWADTPQPVREAVHARVQSQLPEIVETVTDEIGHNINDLLDVKLMVIRHIEANPELANRIFLEVGERELDFVIDSGFFLGVVLGIPTIPLFLLVSQWWTLPVAGVLVGYLTNWIAIKVIYLPVEETQLGPITLQGLFIRRQREVSDVYAEVISEDVITLANMGRELLHGRRSDRTRRMIEDALRPAVDRAMGPAGPAVRMAMGPAEYDAIRESVATEAVEYTMTPLTDPAFNRRQSDAIHTLIRDRMRQLPADDFAEMLRSATEEDEWLLILIGAVLGFLAGWLQLLIVGVP